MHLSRVQELAGASDMEEEQVPEVSSSVTVSRRGRGKHVREVSSEAVTTNKQAPVYDKGVASSKLATLEKVISTRCQGNDKPCK